MFLAVASTKRPIAMTCLLIALTVMGFNAYRKLSVEDMPAVDIPYVTVLTTWVGASPENVEKDISKHIEDAVSGIDGLKHIESSSLENVSQVTLEFNMGIDVDVASQDVREKIDTILSELPADADRPVIQKVNVNASAVARIFLSGDAPIDDLYDYADNEMADRFATVPGVAKVDVVGGNEREVWVELDRDKLASAGLTTTDVANALGQGIVSLPGGRIRDGGTEFSVRFDAEYDDIDSIGQLEVAAVNGARIRICDLGIVRRASEEVRQRAILDGKQGIVVDIVKKAEGNTVAIVKALKERFDEINASLPGGMELTWVSDEALDTQSSIDSAISSVGQAILVCAVVLFFFLANVRTTLIVTITMPATIIISLFFMQLAGQSLNTVTLLAIGLSTGVLVSNSIVVLENVITKMDTIKDKWEAASVGTSEVAISVLASAGTNVVVMLPIAMMTSIVGRMLAPFALTTLIINAVSIFISFTMTPILCAVILKAGSEKKDNAFTRASARWNKGFANVAGRYAAYYRAISKHRIFRFAIPVVSLAVFVVTLKIAGSSIGFSFFENEDKGRVFVRVEFPPYYDLEKTQARLDKIQEKLLDLSDIVHVVTIAGKAESTSGQANEGVYMGQIQLYFKSKLERSWTMNDRLREIRKRISEETDCLAAASIPGKMGGQSFQIDYTLSGEDLALLENAATAIKTAALEKIPEIDQFDTTVRDAKPELKVEPKRTILTDMRLSPSALGMIVRSNIDGIEAANFKSGDRTYDIRVKLKEISGRDQVKGFLIPGAKGRPIPLESVADVVETRTPLQIFRVDKQRSAKFLGDIVPGAAMATVGKKITEVANDNNLIPAGYTFKATGQNEMMGEMIEDFLEAIILATLLTLLTLCAILESWSRPALVLLTLPMALIGVLWSLILSGKSMTVFTLLGILMLIGIVVNGAILIVDRMGQYKKQGMGKRQAMAIALRDEFRPVLMVILASGLGMLPIALNTGIGSENRSVIGIASVGGIIVAGVLTMTILPLIYSAFGKNKESDKKL